jgi:4-diphosphocytidyl-2-C-methyl-D-erythritol kinase
MAWTTALSPAKVNLFLELGARRDDGYHDLDTVMVKVGLFDRLAFRVREDAEIHLQLRTVRSFPPTANIPADSGNLVWRAIDLLREVSGRTFGLDVILEKHIPAQSGLGGGSSNATTTLRVVNRLLGLELGNPTLQELANRLGSDQAFFFATSAARCTGRGDHVDPLVGFQRHWFVIGMPATGLDTGRVFREAQLANSPAATTCCDRRCSAEFCRSWGSLTTSALARRLFNRLQPAATRLAPSIEQMAREFARLHCRGHQMSGSGSAYFGIFGQRQEAAVAARQLQNRLPSSRFFMVPSIRSNFEFRQLAS